MSGYAHLSAEERDRLADLKADGLSLRALGRAASTISRELRRNALDSGGYRPHVADGAYMLRRQRAAVLETDARLAAYVVDRLSEGWAQDPDHADVAPGRQDRRRDHRRDDGHLPAARPRMRGSVTFDNDTCFARHMWLRGILSATTYFCDAYASWQKGGIENANGRIRRWLPRGTDLDALDEQDIPGDRHDINFTPRKCLGYRSPVEAFLPELGRDVEIRFA